MLVNIEFLLYSNWDADIILSNLHQLGY